MRRVSSIIAFAVLAGAWPLAASADNAFTLRDVEIYTGPGSEYPPVAQLPPNTTVDVAGCLSDWSWCDVITADLRGWVYAGDLGYPYENRRVAIIEVGPRVHLPVVVFSLPGYWDAHYRGRPWYRERDVWVNRVHAQVEHGGRPPEGRAARTTPPTAGATPQQGRAQTAPPQGQAQTPQPQGRAQTLPAQPQGQAQTPQPTYTQPREPRPTDARAMPPQSTQPQAQPSPQGTRPSEARPPENRPPENRPPEARGPENRPSMGRGPEGRGPESRSSESRAQREGGPQGDRGQREGQATQGRGENDRNPQQ